MVLTMKKRILALIALLFTSVNLFAHAERPLSIVVIGGGPTGLATAIEARLKGAQVIVIEKRDSYERENTLFLYSVTLDLFDKWGVDVPHMQRLKLKEENRGFVLIKNLEEGLARRVDELGITRLQGEFKDFIAGEKAVLIATGGGEFSLHYDILVGADGAHSCVREKLGIPCIALAEAIAGFAMVPAKNLENAIGIENAVHSDVFIKIVTIPTANVLFVQNRPGVCGKGMAEKDFAEYASEVGWQRDAELIASGRSLKMENIHIDVQRAAYFSDPHRAAILLGDAAGSGTFYRGMGANYALKTAELAGDFFQRFSEVGAYERFEQDMGKAVDTLIQDSMQLFMQ